jgi:hypothetical protein
MLVDHYINAHRNILNKPVFVNKKLFGKFSVFEDDLREMRINTREYAYTVIKMLKSWMLEKHLNIIPINVFCGDWALAKYVKVKESESVVINTNEEDHFTAMLYSELLVARTYISDAITRKGDIDISEYESIIVELTPMLHTEWLQMYHSELNEHAKVCRAACEIICNEYGMPKCSSYEEIISKIRANQ